ncbi:MAG: CvpA family protein, partial [Candidatus Omnitrophica bacterium]|nr:CvpA family protein [Candidatus Omnitrophota bacterium]
MEALQRANWVDIITLILILRITYVGSFLGIGSQILPVLSLLFILTVSLYSYDKIAFLITERSSLTKSVTEFVLFVIIISICLCCLRILLKYINIKRPEILLPVEKVGGIVLALIRSIVITGLILFLLILLPVQGTAKAVTSSATGTFIIKLNLDFYSNIVNVIERIRGREGGD